MFIREPFHSSITLCCFLTFSFYPFSPGSFSMFIREPYVLSPSKSRLRSNFLNPRTFSFALRFLFSQMTDCVLCVERKLTRIRIGSLEECGVALEVHFGEKKTVCSACRVWFGRQRNAFNISLEEDRKAKQMCLLRQERARRPKRFVPIIKITFFLSFLLFLPPTKCN